MSDSRDFSIPRAKNVVFVSKKVSVWVKDTHRMFDRPKHFCIQLVTRITFCLEQELGFETEDLHVENDYWWSEQLEYFATPEQYNP